MSVTGFSVGIDTFGVNVIKHVTLGVDDQLDVLQGVVGGLIESIPTNGKVTIYVNEEGKYAADGYHNSFGQAFWATVDTYGCIAHGDWMAGTAAVFGPIDDEGELTSAPAGTLEKLIEIATATGYPLLVETL